MKTRRKRPAKNAASDEPSEHDESLAAILLWNETHKLLTKLDHMAHKRPELFRPVARQTFYWPVFISRKRVFDTKNAELMDKIELGADCPYSTKKWRISAPTTHTAMWLHLQCRTFEKQWQLPPLTKKTKRFWFEQGWKYMVNDLHIVPEKDPVLAKLAKSATRKRPGLDEKSVLATKYRGRACDVRAEIKRQLWNAFNVLVR